MAAGSPVSRNGIAAKKPIRYRGYYYDQDTKLYFLNARYYSPEWRRFISPDDTAYLDPESVNGLNH
jgi:RHS repeat-associated protein